MGVTDGRTNHKRSHAMPSALYLSKAGPQNSGTDFAAMVFDNKPNNLRSVKEAEAVFGACSRNGTPSFFSKIEFDIRPTYGHYRR